MHTHTHTQTPATGVCVCVCAFWVAGAQQNYAHNIRKHAHAHIMDIAEWYAAESADDQMGI